MNGYDNPRGRCSRLHRGCNRACAGEGTGGLGMNRNSTPDHPEAVIKWIAGALVVYACILAYFAAPFVITFFASLA